jgi:hypothetical protein
VTPALAGIVNAARASGATVLETPGAVVIVLTTAATAAPDDLLSLEEARVLGKLKSTRSIREAGWRGELRLFGSERSRTVRRGDFLQWLESRRTPAVAGPADADVERRMRRIARRRR